MSRCAWTATARSCPAAIGCQLDTDPIGTSSSTARTVAVVAVTDDDQVVLVRQFRPGPERILLELPGGCVDIEEDIAAAAERELLEETGFQSSSMEVVGDTWLAAYSSSHRFAAVARGCRRVAEPKPDLNEFVEPVVMPMSEFLEHTLGGAMTDQDIALRGLLAFGVLAPTAAATVSGRASR